MGGVKKKSNQTKLKPKKPRVNVKSAQPDNQLKAPQENTPPNRPSPKQEPIIRGNNLSCLKDLSLIKDNQGDFIVNGDNGTFIRFSKDKKIALEFVEKFAKHIDEIDTKTKNMKQQFKKYKKSREKVLKILTQTKERIFSDKQFFGGDVEFGSMVSKMLKNIDGLLMEFKSLKKSENPRSLPVCRNRTGQLLFNNNYDLISEIALDNKVCDKGEDFEKFLNLFSNKRSEMMREYQRVYQKTKIWADLRAQLLNFFEMTQAKMLKMPEFINSYDIPKDESPEFSINGIDCETEVFAGPRFLTTASSKLSSFESAIENPEGLFNFAIADIKPKSSKN